MYFSFSLFLLFAETIKHTASGLESDLSASRNSKGERARGHFVRTLLVGQEKLRAGGRDCRHLHGPRGDNPQPDTGL